MASIYDYRLRYSAKANCVQFSDFGSGRLDWWTLSKDSQSQDQLGEDKEKKIATSKTEKAYFRLRWPVSQPDGIDCIQRASDSDWRWDRSDAVYLHFQLHFVRIFPKGIVAWHCEACTVRMFNETSEIETKLLRHWMKANWKSLTHNQLNIAWESLMRHDWLCSLALMTAKSLTILFNYHKSFNRFVESSQIAIGVLFEWNFHTSKLSIFTL